MKKILLLVLLLIFAACGNNQNNNNDVVDTSPTVETTTPEPTEAEIDRGPPREIIVAGWWQSFMDSHDEMPTPDDPGDYFTRSMQWNHMQNVVMPEKNVIFTYLQLPGAEIFGLVTASVIAGDPIADMVMMPTADVFSGALGGIIQPLEGFVPADHYIFSDVPGPIRPVFHFFDQTWTFLQNHPNSLGWHILVNMDMVNRFGLDDPIELFDRGEWNWDNFRRLLQEATFSSTGTTIDHAGLGGSFAGLLSGLIPANSGFMVNPNDLAFELDSPQTMMALEFIHDILVTDQTYAINHGGQDFPLENTLFRAFQDWQLGDVEIAFDVLPFPMGPMNTTGATNAFAPATAFSIPVGVEDPYFVFSAYDAFLDWAGGDLELIGTIVMTNRRAVMPNEPAVQRLLDMMRSPQQVFDAALVMPHNFFNSISGNFLDGFINRTLTPASGVESLRPPLQNIINEVLDGRRT